MTSKASCLRMFSTQEFAFNHCASALMNDLRRRKADVVVVWALDRLARSLKHLLTIAEECQFLGVDFVPRQNIDTTLPAGRLPSQYWAQWPNSRASCCGSV